MAIRRLRPEQRLQRRVPIPGFSAAISRRGAKGCSRSMQFTAISRILVALSLRPGPMPPTKAIPPFLPMTLTATISDNTAVMFVAKYTNGPLKLFAGYEHIRYKAPSDPQTAFTSISGDFLCANCQAFNNTTISNTAFGVNGLDNKTFQVMSVGGGVCAVTENLDVIGAYYHTSRILSSAPLPAGRRAASAPSIRNVPERSARSLPLLTGGLHESGISIPASCSRK